MKRLIAAILVAGVLVAAGCCCPKGEVPKTTGLPCCNTCCDTCDPCGCQ